MLRSYKMHDQFEDIFCGRCGISDPEKEER